ncbi:MAG TPA: glucose-1-phosphate cytidylyltransferase [Gemmataceae bacterium]|jgi:glucose-1-phosphate cytidylyltransferase
MQVVILCGGQGTRIRDVADDIPKPMIPIGGKPILWHIMKGFAHHGFTDFILCLGYKSWVIKRYFLDYHLAGADFTMRVGKPSPIRVHGSGNDEDWQVTLAETGQDAMTGCRVKRIARYLTGDSFLLTYGDGVANVDLHALIDFHERHSKIGTVTAVQPPGRFGEIEMIGSQVVDFMEKPLLARGRINGGFFVFQRSFLDRLEDDPGLVLEQGPLVELARHGELMAYQHDGFWQPMDNSRDFHFLNSLWAKREAPWNTWGSHRCLATA